MRMHTRFLLAVGLSLAPMMFAAAASDPGTQPMEKHVDKPATSAPATTAPSSAQPAVLAPILVSESPNKYRGYRKVVKDGQEYFCKRQKSTGSRVRAIETCMTRKQIDLLALASRDALDDLSRTPTGDAFQGNFSDMQGSNGGSQMGPMPIYNNR